MKLCIDCKHYTGMNLCTHSNNGISPIDGSPKPLFASTARGDYDKCGEQGNWHEEWPVVQPTSWWEMFWRGK